MLRQCAPTRRFFRRRDDFAEAVERSGVDVACLQDNHGERISVAAQFGVERFHVHAAKAVGGDVNDVRPAQPQQPHRALHRPVTLVAGKNADGGAP